jgi:hypothetical protein
MCGSATFATLVSSTSINVASITVIAMIQGLTAPLARTSGSGSVLLIAPMAFYLASSEESMGH